MSNRISSVSQTNPYSWLSAPNGGHGKSGESAKSSQVAAPQAGGSVTLSDSAQFYAMFQRSGFKVEGGTLGQLFSPAFFAEADSSNDARLSSSEFTSFVEKNGGHASQATRLYQAMGDGDDGLTYAQFRQGVGQGDAKDFFNNLVMTRIKGTDSDPREWLQRLTDLGEQSGAATARIVKEQNG